MPSIERESSRDSERHGKHQHSASTDNGRIIVPMWDSSDPERAPPPLPMNPSSPIVSSSRPNTSSAIQSAHAALTEKARDNGYVTNPPPKRIESPERSLIKGAAHKRMQSLHNGNVRDLSSFLESGASFSPVRSPEKTFGRPSTPNGSLEKELQLPLELKLPEKDSRFMLEDRSPEKQTRFAERESRFLLEAASPEKDNKSMFNKSLERDTSRSGTPTPGRETPTRDMPALRPSLRRPPQSILGENTPPQSATMLALQNMTVRDMDTPLANVTNGSTALVRTPHSLDALSNQILNITTIATSLQREMAQLSRRSKDNATDLVSLKEATNARDEDIRKSLRELVTGLSESASRSSSNVYGSSLFLDNKAHNSPGSTNRAVKAFTLPRIPSPSSFAASLDRESTMMSPAASYCHDGVTNIALLEKILREMSTREGHEQMANQLLEVADRLAKDGTSTSKKLDELLSLIREHQSHEIVPQNGGGSGGGSGYNRPRNFSFSSAPILELDFDQPKNTTMTQRVEALLAQQANAEPSATRAAEIINEDVVKVIRTIKDSVAQGGGLTAEVKALVRELRGEVLGMGREIGRKLEQAQAASAKEDSHKEHERLARVVQDGLEDLKGHMDSILHEHRRQSASSIASNRVDYQEIYNAVRSAVNEKTQRTPELQKEDIVEAVKEAWENYKPDIELQQFGLEREELLTCLREGIQEYCPKESTPGATRDEVFAAVVEGLKHFVPPVVQTEASLSRDEILDAVRECLEEFEFPSAPAPEPIETGITREDMLDAVNEGLHSFDFTASTAVVSRAAGENLTREDMLEAVKEGLHTFDFPINSSTTDRDISELLPKEMVVEAVQEGLKSFDFAANTMALSREVGESLTRHEVLDAVREGLETFEFPAKSSDGNREPGQDLTRDDVFEVINDALNSFDFPTATATLSRDLGESLGRDEVLEAVKEGLQGFDFSSATSTALTHDISNGLSKDDVYDAVRAGLDDIPKVDGFGGQIFEKLQEIVESMRVEFQAVSDEAKQNVAAHGRDTEQVLDATKDGLEKLREDIETYVDRALEDSGKDEILEKLQENFEGLRSEIELMSSQNSGNSLDAVQGELEHLRETMATSLVRGSSGADKDEILEAIRTSMKTLRTEMEIPRSVPHDGIAADKEEILDALRTGLDKLRSDIEQPQSLVRGSLGADKEEILDALRTGLDKLRSDIEQPQSLVRGSLGADKEEILEALKSGLDGIQVELDRPRDRSESVSSGGSEVLDALHDGLNNLRSDLEKIVNKPVDMTVNYEILDTLKLGLEGLRADIDRLRESGHGDRAVAEVSEGAVVHADSLKRNDIENLEVLITQLRIKVEAFESMPQSAPPSETLSKSDLEAVEDTLRNLQESIVGLATKDRSVDDDGVKRDDVISIETLLRNTKAKIDEIDPEQAVKKDHLDAVEVLISEARSTLADMVLHLEDVSKRDDVVIVEGLVRDLLSTLDEMKEKAAEESQGADKVSKPDIEAVEAVCLEVKASIEQMILSDISVLATKEDIKNLEELVKEFKGRAENQEVAMYRGFEERQAETVGVGERVTEIKTFLEGFKTTLDGKLEDENTSIQTVATLLEALKEKVDDQAANVSDEVKDMFEVMKAEFEKSNAGVVGSKLESDEKFQQTWDRFDDLKLDEKFDELMTKYDDAQAAADAKTAADDLKNRDIESALLGTKSVAEDVKILIDTLGATITESVDKMDESGKTVFSRVDDTFTRVEETHADAKAEHQLTREQVFKTISGIESVQTYLTDVNPKILESVKDILHIVGQHYEHSKTTAVSMQEKIAEIPVAPEVPLIREAPPEPEKYDDAPVHEKLDKLVDHIQVAGESFAHLEMLDKIHQQVMDTAAEVSSFVSNQKQRIADDHEDKERAVEAATIALETKMAQKDHVESTVQALREEEARLRDSVAQLNTDKDVLANQKLRLTADVSSLETALRLRREELHAMEERAEGLERRILEGVIDHSRALLMSKSGKARDPMSRKRVPSHATSVAGSTASRVSSKASTTHGAVSMAMGATRGVVPAPINGSAAASRRILSLNQITHNVPTGGAGFKRSHSVKTNGGAGAVALRKSSWGGALGGGKYGDLNKENLALKESEEDERKGSDGEVSEAGTMRRSSIGTTVVTGTELGTEVSAGGNESTLYDGTEGTGTEWTGSSVSVSESGSEDSEEGDEEQVDEEEKGEVVLFDDMAVGA